MSEFASMMVFAAAIATAIGFAIQSIGKWFDLQTAKINKELAKSKSEETAKLIESQSHVRLDTPISNRVAQRSTLWGRIWPFLSVWFPVSSFVLVVLFIRSGDLAINIASLALVLYTLSSTVSATILFFRHKEPIFFRK